MLWGNNSNHGLPVFLDENRFQYQANSSNQLQLLNNITTRCNGDPVNCFGNKLASPRFRTKKRERESEDVGRQQKLHISSDYNMRLNDADGSATIPNHVSTGLRLAYDDDERNSSVTSASGSRSATPNLFLSLGQNISTEFDLQKEEFDQCIKIQEENMAKGIKEITQRHFHSFLVDMEKRLTKKIIEKDIEILTINRKNNELLNKIKQVTTEAQNWHHRSKYNDTLINVLKNNLHQAISQGGADNPKEGFGECEVDDADSYVGPNIIYAQRNEHERRRREVVKKPIRICKICEVKEVCILLMPCRHLCLCKDCNAVVDGCPICLVPKNVGVEIYLS